MKRVVLGVVLLVALWLGFGTQQGQAQDQTWIQIEARPTLALAQDRAELYTRSLEAVNGFQLSNGWYAIALGPYSADAAATILFRLRALGDVPSDSFLVDGGAYGPAFWPLDTSLTDAAPIQTLTLNAQPETRFDTETPSQARASERALDRPAREELQRALQWFGHYTSSIDGAIGPGTRRAMSAYQIAIGQADTGVLTTAQRARLLSEWQSDVTALGMAQVDSAEAGITLDMPLGMVSFDRFEAPFVHYEGDGARLALLISQEGSGVGLAALYEIMQTLEIIPRGGERSLDGDSFEIRGRNGEIASYTYAALDDGLIKGFTLVWPLEDARLMDRAAQMMRTSFTPVEDQVLDPTLGSDSQSVDLLSGLEIRKPIRAASGFFVTPAGDVLTTDATLQACGRVTIGEEIDADVRVADAALGLALLTPRTRVAPMSVARFRADPARLQSEVAVSGYSYAGLLGAPTLSYGLLADLKGLDGEEVVNRLAIDVAPGDAGGPVLDSSGGVLGLLLPRAEDSARVLPGDVNFATASDAITAWLSEAGVAFAESTENAQLPPERLAMLAGNMTVLVSCWE